MYRLGLARFYRGTEHILAVWEDGWSANNKNLVSESSPSFCCLLEAAPSPCSQPCVHAGKPIYLVRAVTLSSLAGCELLLAGSRSAAARADAEQRRRDPVVRVPGVRGHRQRHGHHPWERAAAVRKGVCSVDGASVSFKPSSC